MVFHILILKYLILSAFLVHLTHLDIKFRRIPNNIIIPLLLIGLFFLPFSQKPISCLVGLVFLGIIMFLLNIYLNHFIGGGDIKLIMCIGVFTGISASIFIIVIASILCLLWALCNKFSYFSTTTLPFCPFLTFSFIIYLFLYFFIQ